MIHSDADIRARELSQLESYFERLWPLLRSITGAGVRETHDILGELISGGLERFEIPTGTNVFDWDIPQEWRVNEAYILDPHGQRILDVRDNNLHLLNYSIPFRGTLNLGELDEHLHSLPSQPDAIPYLTSYYAPRWGFCLTQTQRDALPKGNYKVVVDTQHFGGSLTLSEAVLEGETKDEVLISTYTCHPSMANNELSGPLVAAFLYQRLAALPTRRLSYRFVFLPETIGSITYLHLRGDHLKKHLLAGYVVTCAGNAAPFTYKRSRLQNSLADRAAEQTLKDLNVPHKVIDFAPLGSDERQYSSPGFNLPVGSLMRSMYGEYKEYHTSKDNKDFISFEALQGTVDAYEQIMVTLESNLTYLNLHPHGEIRLDKHGLYDSLGHSQIPELTKSALWLLNYADGEHDVLSIAQKSALSMAQLDAVGRRCLELGLVAVVEPGQTLG